MKNRLFRFLSFLLLPFLMLSLSPFSAFAEDAEPAEDAEIPAEAVEISSVEEFLLFAENCTMDSYSRDVRFLLTADLDLSDTDFSPIQLFFGSFDGGNHSIRGLSVTSDGSRQGLFRRIGTSGEVRNLFVSGSVCPGGTRLYVGGIAGENAGVIHNCGFAGTVEGTRYIGGIAGNNTGTISHCSFSGTLTGERDAGGIAGISSGSVLSCANYGKICSTPIDTVTETEFNFNTFDISQLTTEDFVNISNIGGIAGSSSGTVGNCANEGAVGYKYQGFNIGGITGKTNGYVENCRNQGTVWGQRDVGGIAGQLEPYVSMVFTEDLLEELQTEMDGLNSSVSSISGTINNSLSAGADTISQMTSYTQALAEEVAAIVPTDSLPDLSDLPIPGESDDPFPVLPVTDTPDYSQITANLNLLLTSSNQLIYLMGNAASGISGALRSVNTHVNAIQAILQKAVDNASDSRDLTEDISVRDAYVTNTGAISACENAAPVRADTNAGGILGICAVELSFDVAGELDISSYIYTDAITTFFSVVRDCTNKGDVTVRDSYSGGITGRMAQGAIVNCGNSSEIRCENGDFCGGITGLSNGSVIGCCARSSVSGTKYLGGICGLGTAVRSCLSHVNILDGKEYIGAIAGSAEGDLAENLFLTNPIGGIDGASYAGKAEPIDYTLLPDLENVPDFFLTVSVRFVQEDGSEMERTVRLGETLRETPSVPDNVDGQPWQWDNVPAGRLFENVTVTGHYVAPIPVLASSEARPVYLVEGVFSEDHVLSVQEPELPFSASGLSDATVLCSAALLVENGPDEFLVHMLAPSNGNLYLLLSDGTWAPLSYEADGSYIRFRLPNGAAFAYTENVLQAFPVATVCGIAGAVILSAALVFVLVRRKKRAKTVSAPVPTDGPDSEKPSA